MWCTNICACEHSYTLTNKSKNIGKNSPEPYCVHVMRRRFCLSIRDKGCRDGSADIGSAPNQDGNIRKEFLKINVAQYGLSYPMSKSFLVTGSMHGECE